MFMGIGALLLLVGAIWMIVVAVQSENSTAAKLIRGIVDFLYGPVRRHDLLSDQKSRPRASDLDVDRSSSLRCRYFYRSE